MTLAKVHFSETIMIGIGTLCGLVTGKENLKHSMNK